MLTLIERKSMNSNYLCCLDFETVGQIKPSSDKCQPIQLASCIIHPRRLEIVAGSEFNCVICPEDWDIPDDSMNFHMKVTGKSKAELLAKWREGLPIKQAWSNFVDYLDKWHKPGVKRKSFFSAALSCGYNNFSYDDIIIQRLATRFGNINSEGGQNLFYSRDGFDVMKLISYFFENNNDVTSISLDNMRDYFGLSRENGHDALQDVKQTAELLIRFLKLSRSLQIKFKGAFNVS